MLPLVSVLKAATKIPLQTILEPVVTDNPPLLFTEWSNCTLDQNLIAFHLYSQSSYSFSKPYVLQRQRTWGGRGPGGLEPPTI